MAILADIYGKIDAFSRQNLLFEPNDKVLAALSGGADSVFLLRYLIARGYDVVAAHCNFHLRDEESMRDELFVRELCQSLHIPLQVKDFDTQAVAQQQHISIEMAARELRYAVANVLARLRSQRCGDGLLGGEILAPHLDSSIVVAHENEVAFLAGHDGE